MNTTVLPASGLFSAAHDHATPARRDSADERRGRSNGRGTPDREAPRPDRPAAGHQSAAGLPALDVLLVEDDAGDVALVRDFFAVYRIRGELHVVSDGVEALRFLRRTDHYAKAPRPHLILLDLNMPRMDGRQVLTAIKSDPDLSTIPAVVFTTSSAVDDINHSYAAHANAYVTKPLDVDDFQRVVYEIHRFYGGLASRPR